MFCWLITNAPYDVRKVDWGMTVEEVLKAELPLKPVEQKQNELSFEINLEDMKRT